MHFQIENITALKYVLKLGGQELKAVKFQLFDSLFSWGITITEEHFHKVMNVQDKFQPKQWKHSSKWKLDSKNFYKICQPLEEPEIEITNYCKLYTGLEKLG